jgi:hypothetical protein
VSRGLLLAAAAFACGHPPAPAPGHTIPVPETREHVHYYDAPIAAFHPDDAGPYRVTVVATATPDTLAALDKLATGAEPVAREDDRTLVYRFTDPQRKKAAALSFVTAVDILQPADRVAAQLAGAAGRVEVVIDLFPGSPARQQAIAGLLVQWGAQVHDRRPGTLRLAIDGDRLLAAAGISDVRWIEPAAPPPTPAAP